MPKANNYNEYNYDQVLDKKHMGWRQYTLRGLSMRSGSGVELRGLDQRSNYAVGTRNLISEGWWRKINSRAVSHRIWQLLVLLPINPYVWLKELSIIHPASLLPSPHFSFSMWPPHVTSSALLDQQSFIDWASFHDSTVFWVMECSTWLLPFTLNIFLCLNLIVIIELSRLQF